MIIFVKFDCFTLGIYGVGRDAVGRQRLTQAAHPPPAAMKHPVAARSPNIPVAAPSGRPAGIKYPPN